MRDRGPVIWGAAAALSATALLLAGCDLIQGKEPAQTVPPSPSFSASVPVSSAPTIPTTTTTYQPAPKVFDHAAVQDAVHKVLTEYHQVKDLGVVVCPRKVLVEKGKKFNCTATIDGEKKKVPITVTTDEGKYEVGAPK